MPADGPETARDALARYLTDQRVDATLFAPGAEMPTAPLAAAALGVEVGQIVKSLVFEGKTAPCVGIAIVPGDVRVDRARVAAALGLPPLTFARPDVVLRATGFAVGGVPPVGHVERLPVVVDARVMRHAVVFGGGGDEHHLLRIAPAEIVRLTGAVVADIVASR